METFFITIYNYLKDRKPLGFVLLALLLGLFSIGAFRLKMVEDISQFLPDDPRVEQLNFIFQNSRFSDKVVVMVSAADTLNSSSTDSLIVIADEFCRAVQTQLMSSIDTIEARINESIHTDLFQNAVEHLPVFLNDNDYLALDSICTQEGVKNTLEANYKQLISPMGVVSKKIMLNDPLGFSFLVLQKMKTLQVDEKFELYDDYVATKDGDNILLFIHPKYPASETKNNLKLINGLDEIIDKLHKKTPSIKISYFGATAVAVGNAKQMKADTLLTLSMTLVLLSVFIFGFFKKWIVFFLIFLPVVFGVLFSLFFISLFQGSISILAIAAGSAILGIAVNYSLHFLTHLRFVSSPENVIRDLAKPMTLGSATTILAFLFLQFANASVLRDLGLFAAFSLIGAAICTLIFLPLFLKTKNDAVRNTSIGIIEKIAAYPLEKSKVALVAILFLTPFFLFFAPKVQFNSDLSQLNYMSEELHQSQQKLERLNDAAVSGVYITAEAATLEGALRKNEQQLLAIDTLQKRHIIDKFNTVAGFFISDSLQQKRIAKWSQFWTEKRIESVTQNVKKYADLIGYSNIVHESFKNLVSKDYQMLNADFKAKMRSTFFNDFIIEESNRTVVVTLAQVQVQNKTLLQQELLQQNISVVDKQMLINVFTEFVRDDFYLIVSITSLLVFFALLGIYGRIELALITFIPMLITWIWILGIMAIVGIQFNIVNVMVSTFIFGLGDDYSIFTMDSLLRNFQFNKKTLVSVRTSILLSVLTTISGLGVLIFAGHPALRSVAAISLIGIACVFFMSQTIQPFLFRTFISGRAAKGFTPATFKGILITFFSYFLFIFGAFMLTIIGLIFKLIPLAKNQTQFLYHCLLSNFAKIVLFAGFNVKWTVHNYDKKRFKHPHVLIANHASFLDILITISLHPKLILLTKNWVWNSPVFGGVVRMANYFPVNLGAESSLPLLRNIVAKGYSIVVFPEGSRSATGTINRFHKGAFYIAEKLKLPIVPLFIHGSGDLIKKGDFYLNDGEMTLKFLNETEIQGGNFAAGYVKTTKAISKYFKNEFASFKAEIEDAKYFRYRLLSNYKYKGPVLEWYMRIKLKLENNYQIFHDLIPKQGSVLDLGCGYGALCYMLHFLSAERIITGVDYDDIKIETAKNCYSANENVKFYHSDISSFALNKYDAIVIADVLHYLNSEQQKKLLLHCAKALNDFGIIIIRDGDSEMEKRHQVTKWTEWFSIKLFKFNKSTVPLNFILSSDISKFATAHNLDFNRIDNTKRTSNIIFTLTKNKV